MVEKMATANMDSPLIFPLEKEIFHTMDKSDKVK